MVIGAGHSMSVLDVVDAVGSVTGAALDVEHGPARPGEMPAVIVDPTRARELGWSAETSFAVGLRAIWEEWSAAEPEALAAEAAPGGMPG